MLSACKHAASNFISRDDCLASLTAPFSPSEFTSIGATLLAIVALAIASYFVSRLL